MPDNDWPWMQRALEIAERGRGFVEPNPLVGAVVVRDAKLVSEGWHQAYGAEHAEVNALAAAGPAAKGATLYVTLEPCCHHGKTPPCTDAVLRSGVARTVAAMPDPFPQVAGKGLAVLRAAGIEVEVGLGEAQSRELNAPYLKLLASGRPYVHVKWAMSLDGKIATRSGASKWISGAASRGWVQTLRGRMDAILIGSGTARADDPLLLPRPPGPRTPVRVILSNAADLPLDGQLVSTARAHPVLVIVQEGEQSEQAAALRAAGCEVLQLAGPDRAAIVGRLLDELGRRRFTNVLVEGGSALFGSFVDARAVDEVHVFIGPLLLGGALALPAVGGQGVEKIAEALEVATWQVEQIDRDIVIHGKCLGNRLS